MGKFFGSGKEGPASYAVKNKKVVCQHCGGDVFEKRSFLLNTPGMTLMTLDWAEKTASTLLCVNCGNIQWFLAEPEKQ